MRFVKLDGRVLSEPVLIKMLLFKFVLYQRCAGFCGSIGWSNCCEFLKDTCELVRERNRLLWSGLGSRVLGAWRSLSLIHSGVSLRRLHD